MSDEKQREAEVPYVAFRNMVIVRESATVHEEIVGLLKMLQNGVQPCGESTPPPPPVVVPQPQVLKPKPAPAKRARDPFAPEAKKTNSTKKPANGDPFGADPFG